MSYCDWRLWNWNSRLRNRSSLRADATREAYSWGRARLAARTILALGGEVQKGGRQQGHRLGDRIDVAGRAIVGQSSRKLVFLKGVGDLRLLGDVQVPLAGLVRASPLQARARISLVNAIASSVAAAKSRSTGMSR